MKKPILILMSCIIPILAFTSCSSTKNQPYEESSIKMDTPVRLKATGPDAKKAVQEGMKRLDELDKMASSNIATSDVSKINNAAGKSYVKVHPEIMKMIETSLKYSKLSNGAWDITTGPLINLWGIGTDKEKVPSPAEIKAALPLVGYEKISVNEKDSSIMLQKPGMAIDLGGIAKGFAADELLKIYKKYNIQNGLIDLGSSTIYALGNNDQGKPWTIGIKHPRNDESGVYLGIIKISNEALSTSGDYERYFIKDGKRYCHILDPATGYPSESGAMSDTIVVDTSSPDSNMIADLLTTTVFVLGPDKGIKFIDSLPKVSGEITTTNYKVYRSSGFKDRISDLNADFKFAN